ncbi:MAG: hypothetical protein K2K90_15280 [Lachnospiraceae bacterium]|nr:hypothetical protein [Lachnospiraceae bacterium]
MMYLIKAELYKFKKDISVWIISFILTCCASISIYTGVYSNAENTVLNLGKDSMILILACAIYVGFSCTDDFTNRTVIYAITYGNRRLQILLAKYCRYIFGCTIIIITYMSVSMVISLFVLGTIITLPCLFMYAVKSLFLSLPLFWGIATIFFFFAIITRKSTMAMGISVACSIIGVVFTNKAYFSMQQSNNSLLRFSPIIQIPMIYEQTLSAYDYTSTIIISIFIMFILLLAGSVIFNKAEL